MRRNFSVKKITDKLRPVTGTKKDPRAPWKILLGVLAVANVLVFLLLVRPIGGSASELDQQLAALRQQAVREQQRLRDTQAVVKKVRSARGEQEKFMGASFMDRRTASSAILTEIGASAKLAGLSPKEHSFAFEPVEGSDNLSMMTINANYEGTYAHLLHFVNLVDRSAKFLIIDTIQAAPTQQPNMLAARFKLNTFVRENVPRTEAPKPAAAGETAQ